MGNHTPQPTIEELIDIAIASGDKDNITGASIELSGRENYNKEDFRTGDNKNCSILKYIIRF